LSIGAAKGVDEAVVACKRGIKLEGCL